MSFDKEMPIECWLETMMETHPKDCNQEYKTFICK